MANRNMASIVGVLAFCLMAPAAAEPPVFTGRIMETFETFDGRQGVAVDRRHFYAVNNFRITQHSREDGTPRVQWDGRSDIDGPLVHLDSGVIHDGRLYAAHSNYPHWPMTSSVEIWNAETLEHVDSISFGIASGSLTWVDRHDGYWWGAFGNYDKIQNGQIHPYGETRRTQVVQMDDAFEVIRRWTYPPGLLERMRPMSNSGGSWGPDGLLYITGHDHPEIYVVERPSSGSMLEWIATVEVEGLNGQGIAWDRSTDQRVLWGILKQKRHVHRMEIPPVTIRNVRPDYRRWPGDFATD